MQFGLGPARFGVPQKVNVNHTHGRNGYQASEFVAAKGLLLFWAVDAKAGLATVGGAIF